jgi:glycosyltransferase involved in cell wall biosynthesis
LAVVTPIDRLQISVVIPSWNAGPYIRAAIESALSQEPPPFEIVVQDGGSTDDTIAIVDSFGPPVSLRSEPDRGQADALNRAIARVTGDVVVWLNADDLLAPGANAAALALFESRPELDFVYGDFDVVDADGAVLRHYRSSAYDVRRVFTRGCYIFSGAIFYRRSLLEKVGPFDVHLHGCMDFDYLLRLEGARWASTRRAMAQFRMSGGGKSSTMRSQFLRESHAVRWRHAGRSARRRLLTLILDIEMAIALWTQPLRLTRAWLSMRRVKLL